MKQSRWSLDGLLPVVILLGFILPPVSAQCTWVTVSGSVNPYAQLNGNYYFGYTCNQVPLWDEQYASNNIFYTSKFGTAYVGWAIGPTTCLGAPQSLMYAINYKGSYFLYPYQLSSGTWYELNTTSNKYVLNPYLTVTCSSYLSAGAITGIVLGSICCAILLLSLIGACCRSCRYKKERRATVATVNQVAANTVVVTPGYPNVAYYASQTNAGFSAQPSEFDPANTGGMYGGLGSSMVQPPAYDNLKPPDYDQTMP